MYKIDVNGSILSSNNTPVNVGGLGFSRIASGPPSNPQLATPAVSFAFVSVSSLTISWLAINNANRYTLERATTPQFDQDLVLLYTGPLTSYADTLLYPEKQYYYRVKAKDTNNAYTDSAFGSNNVTTQKYYMLSQVWRYASGSDVAINPQFTVGDVIIDGGNSDSDIYIPQNTGPTLIAGQKIWIRGGKYNIIELDLANVHGAAGNPVIITTYGGAPVVFKRGCRLFGGSYIRYTGKYDTTLGIGQPNLRGHDADYAWRHRSYGFIWDCEWSDQTDSAPSGLVIDRGGQHFEIDYYEGRDGGFAPFFIRDANNGVDYLDISIHDCLVYCPHGEAVYIGATAGVNGERRIRSLHFYNNTLVYPGNDGIQINNLADNVIVENNVQIGSGANWRDAFEQYQDNGQSLGAVKGGLVFRKNISWGSGEKQGQIFLVGPSPAEENGTSIDIDNNIFYGTKGNLMFYTANTGAAMNNTPLRFRGNYWGKGVFIYDQVYTGPRSINTPYYIRSTVNNQTITLQNNTYDGTNGKTTFIQKQGSGNTYVESNNIQAALPDVQFQKFLGFGDSFNYDNVEFWAHHIGTQGGWDPFESLKGNAITYAIGKYVIDKGFFYRSKAAGNTNIQPKVTAGWQTYWSQVYWNKTTGVPVEDPVDKTNYSPLPPLDVRLVDNNSVYQQTGIGLLDNPHINTTTVTPSVVDNGDNTFTLTWEKNRSKLTQKPIIQAIGSSTFFGTGASSTANSVLGRVETWLATVGTTPILGNNGVASTDSRYGSVDGSYAQVTPHKNITAALSTNPTAILVGYPTNDILIGTAQEFVDRIVDIFEESMSKGVPCFVGSPQPRSTFSPTEQTQLSVAASTLKSRIPTQFYIDVFNATRDTGAATAAVIHPTYSAGDGVHYNDAGHQLLANEYIAKIDAYFQDQVNQGYEIEVSTSPTSGFTLLATENTPTNVSRVIARAGSGTYYYRVRTKISAGVYSEYSDVVAVSMPIAVGSLIQTLNFDFGPDTNITGSSGWNVFSAPAGGAPFNLTLTGIVDSTNTTVPGVTARVTKAFSQALTGGASSFAGYPTHATQDSWTIINSAIDSAEIEIAGLTPGFVYNAEIASSRAIGSTNWMTGVISQGKMDGSRVANANASANNVELINLNGLIPDGSGKIFFNIRGLQIGYLNLLTLKKYNNTTTTTTTTTAAPTTTTTTTSSTTTTTTNAGGAPNQSYSTITVGSSTWNTLEKKPYDYNSNPTATYPLIIYYVGLGQAGTNQALLLVAGPNRFIDNGTWDGRVTVGATVYDPIIVSVQPRTQWPVYASQQASLDAVLAKYAGRVNLDKVYLSGFSMGGWMTSGIIMNGTTYADKIAAVVNVQGVSPDDWGAKPYTAMGNLKRGRWLGFEQSQDNRSMNLIVSSINAANPGESPVAAQYYVSSFNVPPVGGHGAENEFYDPNKRAYGNPDGVDDNIYEWMMKQTRMAS